MDATAASIDFTQGTFSRGKKHLGHPSPGWPAHAASSSTNFMQKTDGHTRCVKPPFLQSIDISISTEHRHQITHSLSLTRYPSPSPSTTVPSSDKISATIPKNGNVYNTAEMYNSCDTTRVIHVQYHKQCTGAALLSVSCKNQNFNTNKIIIPVNINLKNGTHGRHPPCIFSIKLVQ